MPCGRGLMALCWFGCICLSEPFVVPTTTYHVKGLGSVSRISTDSQILQRSLGYRSAPKSKLMISCKIASGDTESFGDKPAKKNGWFRFPDFKVTPAKIASLGASAALSYGAVSNLNMGVCAMMAFATFGKSTGLSPLAPGAMPKFAAVYAGYWIAMNFLRPARIAVAVTISPLFDRLMGFMQKKFSLSKPAAFALVVFLVNVVGNLTFLISGLFLTSSIIGIPLIPP
jgi:hypothetical protein